MKDFGTFHPQTKFSEHTSPKRGSLTGRHSSGDFACCGSRSTFSAAPVAESPELLKVLRPLCAAGLASAAVLGAGVRWWQGGANVKLESETGHR